MIKKELSHYIHCRLKGKDKELIYMNKFVVLEMNLIWSLKCGGVLQGFKSRIEDVREEILRKRRAGKLPGDTTTVLKNWWQQHSKWPYPTVSKEKINKQNSHLRKWKTSIIFRVCLSRKTIRLS